MRYFLGLLAVQQKQSVGHPLRLPYLLLLVVIMGTVWPMDSATAQTAVPANASATYTGGWSCNLGYKRVGNGCEEVDVPANASATYTGGWSCNLGYKRVESRCAEMTPEEKVAQQRMIALMRASARSATINVDGNEFTLSDVERRCEAYVYDNPYGELECSGNARIVGRKCEVYIYSWPNGEIDCRGSGLREVERRCSVSMYSEQYGDVSC